MEIIKLKELLAVEVKQKEFMAIEIANLKNALVDKEESETNKPDEFHQEKIETVKEVAQVCAPKKLLPPNDYALIETLRNDQKEVLFIYDEMMK